MIERLAALSVQHRGWAIFFTLVLAVCGAFAVSALRFDALPDVTGEQVVILTRAPGLTPEEVERLVTRPLEAAIGGVPGLVAQRSICRAGISSITAVFEDGIDLLRARQMVGERIAVVAADLPRGVDAPELGPLTGGLGEIYHFTLRSPSRSPAELLEFAEYRAAPLLRAVPGVVEVNTWGGAERTFDIVGDPVRMARFGVTLADLRAASERATGNAAGGILADAERGVLLRGVAWPEDTETLGAEIVRAEADRVVRLSDVASIEQGARIRIGAATEDGAGEVVYVMVQMLRGANALEVLERIHDKLPDVQQSLPADVQIHEVYDRSHLVFATLRTVAKNLLEGGLLVAFVLFVMLGSARAGMLVASVIPLSMLGAAVGMVAFNIPGNLMSLGALDFGLLVDGAVVMVEAICHRLQAREESAEDAVSASARAMARPVFYAVLIILLVYVPILSLSGVEGKLFHPMALTVVFALAFALLLSLTYVPAASYFVLNVKNIPTSDPWPIRAARRVYKPLLFSAQKRPFAVLAMALGSLALGGVLFSRSGTAFVPQLREGDLVVQTTLPSDIRIESAVAYAGTLERALRGRVPEVLGVASRIGSPAVATDIMGVEQADVFVRVKPRDSWRAGLTDDALLADIDRAIARDAPDVERSFTQPIEMRFNELLGGSVSDVTLSLYGEDFETLDRLARRAAEALAPIPGAADVHIYTPPAIPTLEVRPDPLGASMVGLSTRDVLDHVAALRTGIDVGATYLGPVRVPVRVRIAGAPAAYRLEDAAIPIADGHLVTLSRIARIERRNAFALVSHEHAQRRVVIGFNVRGRDLGGVVQEAQHRLASAVPMPAGYRAEWGGQYESFARAKGRLAWVIPAVLLMILAVLGFYFRDARAVAIISLNVPFAAVGGVIALSIRGLPISISAAIGFIALSGIAVLNGVVLMTRLRAAEQEGLSPKDAAESAALSRMRPVLMTALVAALGFVPMMLATGAGAEVQSPLATVVVGGLFTSTLLTLLILPSLYPWFAKR